MTVNDVRSLEKIDKLMFNLNLTRSPKTQILKVGQLLKQIGMIADPSNIEEIIVAYNHNIDYEIKNALRKKSATTVSFNTSSLKPFLNNKDEMVIDIIKNWQEDLKKYGQIVLRFKDNIVAWRREKSVAEYQHLVTHLDHKRTEIHNNCINDLAILNRLTKADNLRLYAVWDNQSLKEIKDIPRGDIGNAIILQYLDELKRNEKLVLNQFK